MPPFHYKAADAGGKIRKGFLDADSKRQALLQLQEMGLTPVWIEASSGNTPAGTPNVGSSSLHDRLRHLGERLHPVGADEVAAVIRQLSTLLAAGLPLDDALAALCTHARGSRLHDVFARIRSRVMEGVPLADSLSDFPRLFSPAFVTMVRAGEASGTLEMVLARFSEHLEQQLALRRKVGAALAYPVLMLIVGLGVVVFLMAVVMPEMTKLFTDMHRTLPLPTRILLGISAAFRAGWLVLAVVLAASVPLLLRALRTAQGRRFRDRLGLRLPVVREVYRTLLVGQMTRLLGMLLQHGVPLVRALELARSVSGNVVLAEAVGNMLEGVQTGRELSEFMSAPLLFTSLERQMVAAGERGGQLSEMLLWVAKDCETRLASRLQVLTALLEPCMILLLGGIVGFVVMAVMLPLLEMSTLAV